MKVFDVLKARKVLERVNEFLGILIRENLVKDAPFLDEGELENESDLADDVWEVLQGIPRNCDIGTIDNQIARHYRYCSCRLGDGDDPHCCGHISCSECVLRWAQKEYKEEGNEQTDPHQIPAGISRMDKLRQRG